MRIVRQIAIIALLFLAAPEVIQCPALEVPDPRPRILSRLVAGIERHEHCSRWNNPGCLVYARQPGARRNRWGYATFGTAEAGRGALLGDVGAKLRRGLTVAEIVYLFSPAYLEDLLRESHLRRGDSMVLGAK